MAVLRSATVVLLCLCALSGCTVQGQDAAGSTGAANCLELLLVRAGVPLDKAIVYRQNLASLGFDLPRIESADEKLLAFIFEKNTQHAAAVQGCLGGTLAACLDFSPCGVGGLCVLQATISEYQCRCSPYKTGAFCQQHTTYQQLATSLDAVKSATVANNIKVTAVSTRVDALEAHNATCNKALVGYAFNSRHHQYIDDNDHAQLASITYVKKRADTLLKVSYSANIRVFSADGVGTVGGARWFVKIDEEECSAPSAIDIFYLRLGEDNIHIPSVLKGICGGTSGGAIGTGSHTITVHVGDPTTGQPLGHTSNGYGSTQLLEVEEICPPF